MTKINYWSIMTRRKPMPSPDAADESKMGRVFNTFDLTTLGVSATLGVGVYVLAGHVAKLEAGPSVILSFAIAAAASFLAGLCYSEFASRVPRSGSAYIFTYVAIGEFVAFIIGWNLLLEYIIGSASIAKGLSLYLDSLINGTLQNTFKQIAPINAGEFLSTYFDFFAFGGPLLLGFALAFGLRKSAGMNNILCILNLCVVFYVFISVMINANIDNWRIDPSAVPEEHRSEVGAGGFFPFGISGTIKGAATCFFGFVGFDCIATTGEEVKNPRKAVPRAILFSLLIIFLAYFGVALLTLMWPYYLLDIGAPLPHVYEEVGWEVSKWVVSIGGIVGLIASLFGAMFPLPRILYAMSMDGLIFREFGIISARFQTPVIGTLIAAALTSCFAGLFDLAALVNMLSIGVLLAYTVVAISIIILRFSEPLESSTLPITNGSRQNETSNLLRPGYNVTVKGFFMQMVRYNSSNLPNNISMTVVGVMITLYCIISFALALLISYGIESIVAGEKWALISLISLSVTLLIFCLLISIQPRQIVTSRVKPFMVPIVPFLPAISVFINIYLMLMLDLYTWIRFGIWMFLGIFVYFPSAWLYNRTLTPSTNNDSNNHEKSTDNVNENGIKPVIYDNVDEKSTSDKDTNSAIEILDTILESEEENEGEIKVVVVQYDIEYLPKIEEEVKVERAVEIIVSEYCENEVKIIENDENLDANVEIENLGKFNENLKDLSEISELKNEAIVGENSLIIKNQEENSLRPIESDIIITPIPLPRKDDKKASNLQLIIIPENEMRENLENEINSIINEASKKVESQLDVKPEIIFKSNDKLPFHNQNFLSHLSDVLKKSPSNFSQTFNWMKSEEKSSNLLRKSSSFPNFKEIESDSNFTSLPPGTPVHSETTLLKPKSPPSAREPKKKLSNFVIQSATPPIPVVIKSPEPSVVNKSDFKQHLEQLLSNPPPTLIINKTPIPKPRKSITKLEITNSDESKVEPPETPKLTKTPFTPTTATMTRQRQLFDEVLKTIKTKNEEHD